jgi:phosphatidylserine/phosphatidylglycerophosphate/cardiolipin synthase-like enzyme
MSLQKLRQTALPVTLSSLTPGNQVTLLKSGGDYFPAIEAAFDRARHEIYLESYIYGNDVTGQRVADALKRAVLRGVNVYLLIDGFGSKDLPRSMLERLRAEGVKVLVYRPRISPWTFQRKRCDGCTGRLRSLIVTLLLSVGSTLWMMPKQTTRCCPLATITQSPCKGHWSM